MFEKTFSFWRRLVGQAPAAPPASDQQDRRLWMRYAADLRGNVQLADAGAGDKILAHVRDLSLGGASLEVERPLELGQMLTLELAGGQDEIRSVLACVVRVTAKEPGKWSLGCVFSRELTGEDLLRFGAEKVQAGHEDKRTWVRYDCDIHAAYRKVGDPDTLSHPAKVLNISANGIGLSVNPALNAGALLNVDLLDRSGRMVRTILACVVHTTECTGGDYAVGCNFIRELREDELESLL
jgi:hypothetical protein